MNVRAAGRRSVLFVLALLLAGCPRGEIDNIGYGWIEGWVCNPDAPNTVFRVEVYATNTPGDGTCLTVDGQQVCRVVHRNDPQAIGNKPRKGTLGQCGGHEDRGFRITTPAALLDREMHRVFTYIVNADGGLGAFASRDFDGNTLAIQEPIFDIDTRPLVNHGAPATFSEPEESKAFYRSDHMLFVTFQDPKRFANPFTTAFANDGPFPSASTGVFVPEPAAPWQRGRADAGLRFVVQAFQNAGTPTIGVLANNRILPYPEPTTSTSLAPGATTSTTVVPATTTTTSTIDPDLYPGGDAGIFIQYNWNNNPPKPFRRKLGAWDVGPDQDKIRVEGYFRHPVEFADDLEANVDNNSFFSFVVTFTHRYGTGPKDTRGVWLGTVLAQSRQLTSHVRPSCPPPFEAIASRSSWSESSDGTSSFAFPGCYVPDDELMFRMTDAFIEQPLVPMASWISPCVDPPSASYTREPWDGERFYCFEMSAAQFRQAMEGVRAWPGGTGQIFSTDPADYEMSFWLVNVETWGNGWAGNNQANGPAVSQIGLGMRGLKVTKKQFNFDPWGYVTRTGNTLHGWVCDRDDYSRPLSLAVYATDVSSCPGGNGNGNAPCKMATVTANVPTTNSQIIENCGGTANHVFSYPLPALLLDGQPHEVSFRAINYPTGGNPELQGSPIQLP